MEDFEDFEPIGRKQPGVVERYVWGIVIAFPMLATSIIGFCVMFSELSLERRIMFYAAVFCLLLLMVYSICNIIAYCKMPNILIALCEGKIHFYNGLVCDPSDITEVHADHIEGPGMGKLHITVGDKKFKYRFVADAKETAELLREFLYNDPDKTFEVAEREDER